MKRFTLLVAVGVIFVFLLSSNFASRVGASKDKVHNAEPQVTNQAIKPSGTGETRPHSAKPARRNKFASLLADLGTPQTGTFTSGSSADVDDEEDNDPDRRPGFVGNFDEGKYIKNRDAFIALLRG